MPALIDRSIQSTLDDIVRQYAVVSLCGPRQSGKSTLVKMCYPQKQYYSLENPDTRALISADPRHFLNQCDLKAGVILDEVQRFPELLSYLQGIVDAHRIPGSFILTGSNNLQLNASITQSLAGRVGILELLPLSFAEIATSYSVDNYLLNGFFPSVYQYDMDPILFARNYIKTYVERDVRQLINLRDLHIFQRFLKLAASRIASTINKESLSNDVGVSQNTIKNWISALETAYLVFQLQPYFENFEKRCIKAPKLYFTDVGLASYLLGIHSTEQMNIEKMRGALFENMMVMELVKQQYNFGKESHLYFFRDSHQNEVDIVLQHRGKLVPIEIKSTATFHPALLKNLHYFQKLVGDRAPRAYLIYTGEDEYQIGNIQLLNFKNIHRVFNAP